MHLNFQPLLVQFGGPSGAEMTNFTFKHVSFFSLCILLAMLYLNSHANKTCLKDEREGQGERGVQGLCSLPDSLLFSSGTTSVERSF